MTTLGERWRHALELDEGYRAAEEKCAANEKKPGQKTPADAYHESLAVLNRDLFFITKNLKDVIDAAINKANAGKAQQSANIERKHFFDSIPADLSWEKMSKDIQSCAGFLAFIRECSREGLSVNCTLSETGRVFQVTFHDPRVAHYSRHAHTIKKPTPAIPPASSTPS